MRVRLLIFVADGVHVDEFATERFSRLYGAVAGKELHDLARLSGWGLQQKYVVFKMVSGIGFAAAQRKEFSFGLICYVFFWSLGVGFGDRYTDCFFLLDRRR